jgi:hypothetical protein
METTVTTAAIRDTIELAKLHEQQHQHLYKIFSRLVANNIHVTIQLPKENAAQSLVDFIVAYISYVPTFLDTSWSITRAAKIESYAGPFLQLAQDYFLKPPEIVAGHIGLQELMNEAYLAHRLMEEMNDRFMAHTSTPILPMDMTIANLIVHSLIGEPFSNELDAAVNYTVERTMEHEHVYESAAFKTYIELHKNDNQWKQEIENWSCLTDQLAIHLQFNGLSF